MMVLPSGGWLVQTSHLNPIGLADPIMEQGKIQEQVLGVGTGRWGWILSVGVVGSPCPEGPLSLMPPPGIAGGWW